MIAKIGENIVISDLRVINENNNYLSFYVHNAYRKNIGKIISLLKYSADSNDEKVLKILQKIYACILLH